MVPQHLTNSLMHQGLQYWGDIFFKSFVLVAQKCLAVSEIYQLGYFLWKYQHSFPVQLLLTSPLYTVHYVFAYLVVQSRTGRVYSDNLFSCFLCTWQIWSCICTNLLPLQQVFSDLSDIFVIWFCYIFSVTFFFLKQEI